MLGGDLYKRAIFHVLLKRIQEPRRFIQVLAGPRQVGKTTIARQLMEAVSTPVHFATADEPHYGIVPVGPAVGNRPSENQ